MTKHVAEQKTLYHSSVEKNCAQKIKMLKVDIHFEIEIMNWSETAKMHYSISTVTWEGKTTYTCMIGGEIDDVMCC